MPIWQPGQTSCPAEIFNCKGCQVKIQGRHSRLAAADNNEFTRIIHLQPEDQLIALLFPGRIVNLTIPLDSIVHGKRCSDKQEKHAVLACNYVPMHNPLYLDGKIN